MALYKSKSNEDPMILEALQFNWDDWSRMCDFAGVGPKSYQPRACFVDPSTGMTTKRTTGTYGMVVPGPSGVHLAREGDFIVKHVDGLVVAKQDVFLASFEAIPEDPE